MFADVPACMSLQALTIALNGSSAKAQWNAAAAAARVFAAPGRAVSDGPAALAELPPLLAAVVTVLQDSSNSKARMQVRHQLWIPA